MPTVAEALEEIRYRIFDPDGDNWSNAELLSYMNDAHYALHDLFSQWCPKLLVTTSFYKITEEDISLKNYDQICSVSIAGEDIPFASKEAGWRPTGPASIKIYGFPIEIPCAISYIPQAVPLIPDGELPWNGLELRYIYEYTSIRAQLRDEADMTQEAQLMANWKGKIVEKLSRKFPHKNACVNGYFP